MKRLFPAWTIGVICAWVVLCAQAAPSSQPAPVRLSDPSGQVVEPLVNRGQPATLLVFLTAECPIGNGYAPEIARIVQQYQKQGVVCYGIYAHEKPAEVVRHLKDFSLPLQALIDPELQLAKRTGATVTPEACVLSPAGTILYRGRIDDRAVKFGSVRVEPRVRDLRMALDAILAGKPVPTKFTKAIGCYLVPAAASE